MAIASKSTPVKRSARKAPTNAELRAMLAEQAAALEALTAQSEQPTEPVKLEPEHKTSRKALLAQIANDAGSVQVRSESLSKVFVVAADPSYSRYITVYEQPSGKARRWPTDVVRDIIANPDHYAAVVNASLGRQVAALEEMEADINAEEVVTA